ncbi:MAG: penicillin acylase family protein [Polyangiales bacterium]
MRLQRSVYLSLVAALAACSPPPAQQDASSDRTAPTDAAMEASTDDVAADAMVEPRTIAEIPAVRTEQVMGLDGPVDVVFDRQGWPHIYASSIRDVAYVQGYLCARDRMPQMEMLRRLASGTLTEKFGQLSPTLIEQDLAMRVVGLRRAAQRMWDATPMNSRARTVLEAYARGVNRWIGGIRAGTNTTPQATDLVINDGTTDWTPVDSLTIARYQSYSLSYDADSDISRSELRARAQSTFDNADPMMNPANAARRGFFLDMVRFAPVSAEATVGDFYSGGMMSQFRPSTRAPRIARNVFENARGFIDNATRAAEFLGDQTRGSNNWVVHGSATMSGHPILSNDPHLSLTSPAVWWGVHLTIASGADAVDVAGTSFPGIPWVVIGYNRRVSWGVTTAGYDVTDAFAETIVPCTMGGGDCVVHNGSQVRIETLVEQVPLGTGMNYEARFEVVPHHGIIVPTIQNRAIVPRATNTAISIQWTGSNPTTELETFMDLSYAQNVTEARAAIRKFGVGAQNFVVADVEGNTAYQSSAVIPVRGAAALTYVSDPTAMNAGTGNSPCFVLPGDGTADWNGSVPLDQIPQGTGSATRPFFASANQDQAGVTFDNNPHNDRHYIGCDFADGIRQTRIVERLRGRTGVTVEDMQALQGDKAILYGRKLRPFLQAAMTRLEAEWTTPGTHADLAQLATTLRPRQAAIRSAAMRLMAWSLDGASGVPHAMGESVSDQERSDSTATLIFHAWAVKLTDLALGDELAAMGYSRRSWANQQLMAVTFLLEGPSATSASMRPRTGAVLFDDLATGTVTETKDYVILRALDEALTQLAMTTMQSDMAMWRWGTQHSLTLDSIIPGPGAVLSIPPSIDPNFPNGFPRGGGIESVDAAHPGVSDFNFRYGSGPSQRFVVEMDPAGPRGFNSIPGGQVFNRFSPNHRNLMELWRRNQYFRVPRTEAEVIEARSARWTFTPM